MSENVKAGPTTGKRSQQRGHPWPPPPLQNDVITARQGKGSMTSNQGSREPSQSGRKQPLGGKGGSWGHLSSNPRGHSGPQPLRTLTVFNSQSSHRYVDPIGWLITTADLPPNLKGKQGVGPTLKGEGHTSANDTRHHLIPCHVDTAMWTEAGSEHLVHSWLSSYILQQLTNRKPWPLPPTVIH